MTRDAVLDILKEVAGEVLGVDPDAVQLTSHLQEDLGADSLDLVEYAMALEDRLDLTIPEELLKDIQTVGDALDFVLARLEAAA